MDWTKKSEDWTNKSEDLANFLLGLNQQKTVHRFEPKIDLLKRWFLGAHVSVRGKKYVYMHILYIIYIFCVYTSSQ